MRALILTLGTRGDLELFLGLARELRRRGHDVVVATSGFHASRVSAAGIECREIGDSSREDILDVLRPLSAVPDRTERTRLFYERWLRPQLSRSIGCIGEESRKSDYFISNLKMMLRKDGAVLPGAAVTYDPPGDLRDLPRYRTHEHGNRILDLVALSRALVDPDGRWGERYRFTGFWEGERPRTWEPPAELRSFLDNGPPPVVVTMGSMIMFDVDPFVRTVAAALRLAGQRAVVIGGWSGSPRIGLPPGLVHWAPDIPYDWLFPRAACVVHHGGCGTLAAVLRAGLPSILLPQILCQQHFGAMLTRERLATGVFDLETLDPEELGRAIALAVSDPGYRSSARRWKERVAREGGIRTAADWIESHWDEVTRGELV